MTYYHSGHLGDLIYALSAIKAAGGGHLIVGPEQRGTAPCAEPMRPEDYNLLFPFVDSQDYISSSSYSEKYPDCEITDLNKFRNHWVNMDTRYQHNIHTLCKAHFHQLGIVSKFQEDEPWLTCPEPITLDRIIVHRSPRYHAPRTGTNSFPWNKLVDDLHHKMLFVGLEHEWQKFQEEFDCSISFWQVRDFLELAGLIAGARSCIFNQSFPLSLAIGLGKRVACEAWPASPDCQFNRSAYTDQLLERDYETLTRWV